MKKLLFTLLLLPIASIGQIASWDFTGETMLPTSTPEVYNANLDSPSTLTRGSGAAESAGGNSFRTVGFLNDGISVANTDYFQNTFSAAPGYTLSLSSIDARFAGTTSFSASPGVTMQYAYSLDGTTFTLIGSPFTQIGNGPMTQINLSGISALQNVAEGTTVTIRFYASGQTATGGWGYASASTAGTIGLAFGGSLDLAGGGCNITTSGLSGLTCNNAGTATLPADDFLSFSLTPTGTTLDATYTVSVPIGTTITPTSGNYNEATQFMLQAGSAGGGDVVVTITDNASGTCTLNVNIVDPGACSSATPVVTATPSSLTGFNHTVGTPSAEQTFTVSGTGLLEDIILNAPTNFEISFASGTGFMNTLSMVSSTGSIAPTTIYVRANAAAMGILSGDVTVESLGATTQNVALTGNAIDYVYYLIEEINSVDADGVADSIGVLVELSGVVHCIDFDGNAGYSITMIDESEFGINVYKTTDFGTYTDPQEGDSLLVRGVLTQFNGLLEVVVDEITLLSQNASLFEPLVITELDELSESQYVKIMNVTFVTPIATFPTGNNNIEVTDGSTTFTLRIDTDTDIPGSPAPTGSFNVTGVVGQYDTSSPYTEGYQLFPCGMESFEAACITPDNGVTMTNDSTATADAAGVSYQWYNCDTDMNVAGATNQSFTATVTGNYSVIVSDGACSDTSACVSLVLSNVGLNTNTLASEVSLYPNPIDNVVTISGINTDFYAVTVSDMNGKVVMTDSFVGKKTIETSSWLKGVYFVTIVNNDNQLNIKVIK